MDLHPKPAHLEFLLVKLFRASQALFKLLQEERLASVWSDSQRLKSIAEKKNTYIDTLEQLAVVLHSQPGLRELPASGDICLAGLENDRLTQLKSGIEAQWLATCDLAAGNQSLMLTAFKRIDGARKILLPSQASDLVEEPTAQTPGTASLLSYLKTQELVLQGVMESNQRLIGVMNRLIDSRPGRTTAEV